MFKQLKIRNLSYLLPNNPEPKEQAVAHIRGVCTALWRYLFTLLQQYADQALYSAKYSGRNNVTLFRPAMQDQTGIS